MTLADDWSSISHVLTRQDVVDEVDRGVIKTSGNVFLLAIQSQMAADANEIEHLRTQLRDAGITPMSEFICACGLRKSVPNADKPNF